VIDFVKNNVFKNSQNMIVIEVGRSSDSVRVAL